MENHGRKNEAETCVMCTATVEVDADRCSLHQADHASPETPAEQEEKLRRLKTLKDEVEELSEMLGNPDNGKLTPCIDQIESTISKIEKPVEERFRYGDYRDTSPVESTDKDDTE